MNNKTIGIVALAVAILGAAVAAVVVNVKRAETARALAERAASEEATADAKRREAEKVRDVEVAKRQAAEANRKAKADELKAAQEKKSAAEAEAKTAAARQKTAEADAAARQAEAKTAQANRDKARADEAAAEAAREKAKADSVTAAAKAQEAADQLATEKLKNEASIAETKRLELQKIDFETWQRDLVELDADLRERERALKPEKTIADLSWAGGGEDSVMTESGEIVKQKKKVYNPETDMSLPLESRRLAKAERLAREALEADSGLVKSNIVAMLEKFYVTALKEQRVIDAEFYKNNIKSMYPDWEFKGEAQEAQKKEEGKK